jgi:16S rRNA (guanine527-N7)-methyltransferase
VTSREFRERLSRRARKVGARAPEEALAPLEAYYRLLAQWNVKINLTALPLQAPSDATFDRLFIEPLLAAELIPDVPGTWFDLGSGGGSPALPLKVVRPSLSLTLVESKTRKAAFLREVVRALKLPGTEVANIRFQDLPTPTPAADLVTVRAVRPDRTLLDESARLLRVGGHLLFFGNPGVLAHKAFRTQQFERTTSAEQVVKSFERVFHVEQND